MPFEIIAYLCIYILIFMLSVQFSSVAQLCQILHPPGLQHAITNSQSPFKFMSIESVMPSNHIILCHPLLLLPSIFPSPQSFPASGASQMNQLFASGGQSIGVSASTSVLSMNTQLNRK